MAPASPSEVAVPDSPLHPSGPLPPLSNGAAAAPSPHAIPSYASDDDEPLLPARNATKRSGRGHRTRPSTVGLLGDEGGGQDDLSAEDIDRQRRLRAGYGDEDEEGATHWVLRKAAAPLKSGARFVKQNTGLLLIGLAQLFFANMNVCVKLLLEVDNLPVWELIWIRMVFTFVGCYAFLRWSGDPHPLVGPPGVRLLLCARGVIGFFGLFPGYYALSYLDLTDATTISFLSPVLVGLLAWVFLREPYSRLEALVGLTSLLGTLFIAKPAFLFPTSAAPVPSPEDPFPDMPEDNVSPEQRMFAVGVALFGVLGASGAYLLIRKIGKRASPLHSMSYFSSLCVVVSALYPLVFDAPPVFKLEQRFFLLILPIGIFGFLAQTFLTMGLQREKAGRGTLAVYSNLIFAMTLEFLVFHKTPDPWSLLGALIIVGGAVRVALEKKPVVSATAGVSAAPGSRRASVASVLSVAVDPIGAAEEGRKVKLADGDEAQRSLRLSTDGSRSAEEEDDGVEAGGSGIAAARGLDVER
ncbi:hypothetical protein JCM10213_002012 [Rhodosporidiobolus nylandii]